MNLPFPPPPTTVALCEEIRAARRFRKLTQKSLAQRAGVDLATVQNLEQGRGTVAPLLAVLGVLGHRFVGQGTGTPLGQWLAELRRSARLSQQRLSELACVSKPTVIQIERGQGHVASLCAIMAVLGVSMRLCREEDPGAPTYVKLCGTCDPRFEIHEGDCRDIMKNLAEQGAQFESIITDPPYHLSITKRFGRSKAGLTGGENGSANPYRSTATGFMGKEWDGGDIAFDPETWRAALRLLKPGGYLLAFGGSRTSHRLAVAIEEAGFEIRDTIMWLYGSGFPKSLNVGRAVQGLRGGNSRYSGKTMISEPGRFAPGMQMREMATGEWTGRSVLVTDPDAQKWEGFGTALKPAFEPIIVARKPISKRNVAANVLAHATGAMNIDGCRIQPSDTGEEARDRSHEPGITADRWPANVIHDGIDEPWARYFYCAKASQADRGETNRHPTVKPNRLMRYLVRLVTPPGGTVFDPFLGSGSTGKAAIQEGFRIVGCEVVPEYVDVARVRIASAISTTQSRIKTQI